MRKVEIDANSGFCGGVIRAIKTAEDYLAEHGGTLHSLGAIVHNEEELSRLEALGLVTLDKEDLEEIPDAQGRTIMVRAHGEPPEIYGKVRSLGFKVIDCTCPVVLKLQEDIREAFHKGQIVIFGKIGHPEVLGLVGQVDGCAVVVENIVQLDAAIADGRIDLGRPVEIFSQTTMSPVEYSRLCGCLAGRMNVPARLKVHETICSQVARRHSDLAEFAMRHDVIVFVSGKHSSNGKVLCDLCRSNNIRTYMVSNVGEIRREWFRPDDIVGIGGATSTPKWLLEQVAEAIENM